MAARAKATPFELFLWPVAEVARPRDRLQIILNSKGTVLDLLSRRDWNGDYALETFVNTDRWSAELAIPFRSFEAKPPEPGTVWRANFCRNWWRPKPHTSPVYTARDFGHKGYIEGQGEHDDSMAELWELKARTGINRDDAGFRAYWRPDCPVKAMSDNARASVYVLKDGGFATVVANLSPQPQEVTVAIDRKALGLQVPNSTAVDARTLQPVLLAADRFTVPVKAYNYTVVSIKPPGM